MAYEWVESNSGPPRKYYRLTDSGEEVLIALDRGWNELSETVLQIKNGSEKGRKVEKEESDGEK